MEQKILRDPTKIQKKDCVCVCVRVCACVCVFGCVCRVLDFFGVPTSADIVGLACLQNLLSTILYFTNTICLIFVNKSQFCSKGVSLHLSERALLS